MSKMNTSNNWTIEITGSDDACEKCTRKDHVHNACRGCEHRFSFKLQTCYNVAAIVPIFVEAIDERQDKKFPSVPGDR